jgi:ATP-dependent RNA helicase DOB1
VFEEKSDEGVSVKDDLIGAYRALQDNARRVAEVMKDARLEVDVDEYTNKFQSQMVDIVFAWCHGAKFSEIIKMTDVFEGTIIRCMRRLEELMRQFSNAAKNIGNVDLQTKFEAGIEKLKRDIVFAASLYL